MSTIIRTSSLPCGFATWTPEKNVFVQFNVVQKSTNVGSPCDEANK